MEDFEEKDDKLPLVDFGPVEDKSKGIIKVIGVGGGGCNAVNNMYYYICIFCLFKRAFKRLNKIMRKLSYESDCIC